MSSAIRSSEEKSVLPARSAMSFVILLGVVSLFADMTYEGGRGIMGPYLSLLGASGLVVGFVAGSGELLGYSLRLLSGWLADRTHDYWPITITGYIINLLAVPLLALTHHWPAAAMLMILERVGKGIRNPPRDAMLSHATQTMGRGWGFGLHEAMDQTGALLGPLIAAAVLYTRHDYHLAFGLLVIPAVLSIGTLLAARQRFPNPENLEVKVVHLETKGFPAEFWIYLVGAGCIAAGYADFSLIAYHCGKTGLLSAAWIPIFYAGAMGVQALASLGLGHLFDKKGLWVLILSTPVACLFAPLVFRGGFYGIFGGMALWGIGMAAIDAVMRAQVAEMISPERRAIAYGVFNTGFGIFWFLGSVLMGWLYDRNLNALIIFSVVAQLAAIPFFLKVLGKKT